MLRRTKDVLKVYGALTAVALTFLFVLLPAMFAMGGWTALAVVAVWVCYFAVRSSL